MQKKPENLLNELESISQLLNDSDDNIPILQESIDDASPRPVSIEDIRKGSKSGAHFKSINVDKTKVVIKAKEAKPVASASLKKGDGDNPFLPQHIRTRLKEGKESFMKDQLSQPGNPYEHIIDELVAYYLPQIEEDLRARLKSMTTSFATMPYDKSDIENL